MAHGTTMNMVKTREQILVMEGGGE